MQLYDILSKHTNFTDEMQESSGSITTGFRDLDNTVGGKFNPGETVVMVSPDPMVRISFALNIALKNAVNSKLPTLIMNSESSMEQTAKWVLQSTDNYKSISKSTPLFIEDIGKSDIEDLKERISKIKESSDIGIVIINPMNYVYQHIPDSKAPLLEYLNEMRELAKKLNIVIILTARVLHGLDVSDEIAVGNTAADILISIEMYTDDYEENNMRIVEVNRSGKNTTIFCIGFDRNHLRFYELDNSENISTDRKKDVRDHMVGFEKEILYREAFCMTRGHCPKLKYRDFRPIVQILNPSLLEGLHLRRPCVRKLKYIGYADFPDLTEEERAKEESESRFIVGNLYESKDFNGGTYTIAVNGHEAVIGSAYFEWVDQI